MQKHRAESAASDEQILEDRGLEIEATDGSKQAASEAGTHRAQESEFAREHESTAEGLQFTGEPVADAGFEEEGLLPGAEEEDDLDFLIEDDPEDPNKLMLDRSEARSLVASRHNTFSRKPTLDKPPA